jgi:protein arginine N-methyltransferase 1
MYGLEGYGKMLADTIRLDAYLEALRISIVPGCVVLDLGAGPGVLSLYACRWGARRVYAVEPDDSVQIARELAAANGYGDRIVTIQDVSSNLTLPELAGVIVADLRGTLPFFSRSITSMMDARDRLLTPGGVLIPQRDVIRGTVVEEPELYRKRILAWEQPGFDMSAARRRAVNDIYRIRTRPEHMLAAPQTLGCIDYSSVCTPRFEAHNCWAAERRGSAHGLCLWFESTLAPGILLSNSPESPELIYGSVFFPFEQPIELEAEDRISVTMRADPVGEDYVWRWDTSVERAFSGPVRYSQSTFFASFLTRQTLQAAAQATAGDPKRA